MDLGADASAIGGAIGGGEAKKDTQPFAFAFDGDLLSFDGGLPSMQADPLDSIFGAAARRAPASNSVPVPSASASLLQHVASLLTSCRLASPLFVAEMESAGESAGGVTGGAAAVQRSIRVLELAPAWCYTGGGEKILACFDCTTLPPGIQCRFGATVVGVERVSASVLRMWSPSCATAGVVEPTLVDAQGKLLCTMGSFEYRMPPLLAHERAQGNLAAGAASMQLCETGSVATPAATAESSSAEGDGSLASPSSPGSLSNAGKRTRESEPRPMGVDSSVLPGQLDNIFGIDGKLRCALLAA